MLAKVLRTAPAIMGSLFLRLPREIRFKIFKLSALVDWDYDVYQHEDIWIKKNGERRISRQLPDPCNDHDTDGCDRCTSSDLQTYGVVRMNRISTALLFVNKQLHEEAIEVFLGYNRIVLAHGHDKNLECLMSIPPHLRTKIRHLHIRFRLEHDLRFADPYSCCYMRNLQGWDRLVEWISTNLNLPILRLYVDLGDAYLWTPRVKRMNLRFPPLERHQDLIEIALVARAYRRIARPLKALCGLHSCFVFLPSHFRLEAEIEKAATGNPKYNSLADGKVMPACRNYSTPLAWPPEEPNVQRQWHMIDTAEHLPWHMLPLDEIVQARVQQCCHKKNWL